MVELFLLFRATLAQGREGCRSWKAEFYILSVSLFSLLFFFLLHSWIKIMFQRGRKGTIHTRLCVGAVFGESFVYYRWGSYTRG